MVKVVADAGLKSADNQSQSMNDRTNSTPRTEDKFIHRETSPTRRHRTEISHTIDDDLSQWASSASPESKPNHIRESTMKEEEYFMSPIIEKFRVLPKQDSESPIMGSSSLGSLSLPSCSEDQVSIDGLDSPSKQGQEKKKFGKNMFRRRKTPSHTNKTRKSSFYEGKTEARQMNKHLSSFEEEKLSHNSDRTNFEQIDFSSMIDSNKTLTIQQLSPELVFPPIFPLGQRKRIGKDSEYQLRWKQLLANRKHNDMANEMISLDFHGFSMKEKSDSIQNTFSKTTQHIIHRLNHDVSIHDGFHSLHERKKGLRQNNELPMLSSLLMDFGSLPVYVSSRDEKGNLVTSFQWEDTTLKSDVETSKISDLSIVDLINTAKSNYSLFSALVKAIRDSIKRETSFDLKSEEVKIDIKSGESLKAKADLKYGGDYKQVKDILRASLVVQDENSMMIAISRIQRCCDESNGIIEIVRFKNLFRTDYFGTLIPSNLPTGYRHILFNIRFNKSGLIAGIITFYVYFGYIYICIFIYVDSNNFKSF